MAEAQKTWRTKKSEKANIYIRNYLPEKQRIKENVERYRQGSLKADFYRKDDPRRKPFMRPTLKTKIDTQPYRSLSDRAETERIQKQIVSSC